MVRDTLISGHPHLITLRIVSRKHRPCCSLCLLHGLHPTLQTLREGSLHHRNLAVQGDVRHILRPCWDSVTETLDAPTPKHAFQGRCVVVGFKKGWQVYQKKIRCWDLPKLCFAIHSQPSSQNEMTAVSALWLVAEVQDATRIAGHKCARRNSSISLANRFSFLDVWGVGGVLWDMVSPWFAQKIPHIFVREILKRSTAACW